MKTYVISDIHGAYKALVECLQRSHFNYQEDRLIILGDVCDGYPEVNRCLDELLKIKHCDLIIGNHDLWALDWALKGEMPEVWISQGGRATLSAYPEGCMPQNHIQLLQKAQPWLVVENKIFIHAGFDPNFSLEQQGIDKLVWDRSLIYSAWQRSKEDSSYKFSVYEEIFLGHTPVQKFHSGLPLHLCNVWALDTGAGHQGMLTIMDIHTKEYWQSNNVSTLYPGLRSRY